MRLTLRTLLAYLDDILDPSDAEQLGAKVRESDFASGLVHRIRSVTGRLRLSAPPVEGRGLGADANSVAEYLDNTLPADRVPEFEKVCLESDMHLSEAASCHQVLTLVLGEPAHVDLNLRNRIHNLPVTPPPGADLDQIESRTRQATGQPGAPDDRGGGSRSGEPSTGHAGGSRRVDTPRRPQTAGAAASGSRSRDSDWRGTPGDPNRDVAVASNADYMEADRRRGFPGWLAALLAGFLITAALLVGARGLIFGPRRQVEVAEANSAAAPPPNSNAQFSPEIQNAAPDEAKMDGPIVGSSEGAQNFTDSSDVSSSPTLPSDGFAPGANRNSEFNSPNATDSLPMAPPLAAVESPSLEGGMEKFANEEFPATEALTPSEAGVMDTGMEAGALETGAIAAGDSDTNSALAGDVAGTNVENVNGNGGEASTPEPSVPAEATTPAAIAAKNADWPEADMPKDLGRFASENQILAFWDEANRAWMRMPARATLLEGTHLRVPTLFRPTLMLGSGIQVTLNDRTDVLLEAASEENSQLTFGFGQAIFSSVGDAKTVRLIIDGQTVVVTFGDPQSQFALEVSQDRLPGADPWQEGNTKISASLWPTSGSIRVALESQDEQSVAAGKRWQLSAGATKVGEVKALPSWIAVPKRREIDRQALNYLVSSVKTDRSLTLELYEVVEGERRNERRSLAARALASLGQFDPLLASFGDKLPRNAWSAHYQELLAALARDPQSAERVREAANKYWAGNADLLLGMAVGYDQDELRRVGAAELVQALSDNRLEVRVVAIETLRWITGKTLYFDPDRSSVKRREPTRKWKQLLDDGEITYETWPPVRPNVKG